MGKSVYTFGAGEAEGVASQKPLLGGKGANLAEMNRIGVPVPAGFTITTEECLNYVKNGEEKTFAEIKDEVEAGIKYVEDIMGAKFGSTDNPLLVSVRSGAAVSMPGMMDTVLNLGLNDETVEGLAKKSGNERFAWDSYRRFMQMFGDVVLGVEAKEGEHHDPYEIVLDAAKEKKGVENDTELDVADLKEIVAKFKEVSKEYSGQEFPFDPWDQLWAAVGAVFGSWDNPRAIKYRAMNGLPDDMGTAVNVQSMVYGNMGDNSATGVAFTRDAATGENIFNGEYLINAQGEDVVAGVRTPQQIKHEGARRWAEFADVSEEERKKNFPSLEEAMPEIYQELFKIQDKLEQHYKDMQDLEFTIQDGKLWLLQTRNGKRTGAAMVKMAVDMMEEGMIDEKTAMLRVEPNRLDELLHPVFDKEAIKDANVISKGLPASPGAATGRVVFDADDAEEWKERGEKVILVRTETSPEDLSGMNVSEGILTSRGGMTSHAAVVARGMGKCCVSGAGDVIVSYAKKQFTVGDKVFKEGDWISLNGSTGEVYE